MELDFDLNVDPIEANQEPLNNEAVDQDVQLSFNPLDAPHDDVSSMDSLCHFLETWEGSTQSEHLDIVQTIDNNNAVILGLPIHHNGIPEPDEANAADAIPEMEHLLLGDLLQEIEQAPQVNLNL
jgi:hypothetical protein